MRGTELSKRREDGRNSEVAGRGRELLIDLIVWTLV
jgi:hypothetical protein